MRISAGRWAELVQEWESKGGSARAFAQERGIAEASLRWWKGELSRRSRNEEPRRSPGPTPKREPQLALARVVRESERAPAEVLVVVGTARIAVRPGFDAELLRAVVEALTVDGRQERA